jgi:dihydrofolate synthase/folylpolyglutamate synthase
LRRSLADLLEWRRLLLVFGVLKDKPLEAMLSELDGLADLAVLTTPGTDRAMPTDELERVVKPRGWNSTVVENPEQALSAALEQTDREDIVVVAGSLFLVGRIMVSGTLRKQICLDRSSRTKLL